MRDLFLFFVNLSISASFLVLAVMLLRYGLKKAPKFLTVLLWSVVALRLLCPITIESEWSLLPGVSGASDAAEETTAGGALPEVEATEGTLNGGVQAPVINGTQKPPVVGGTQTPAVDGTQKPPVTGGTQTPAVDGTQKPPVVGGTQTPAVDGTQKPPVTGGTQTPAVDGTQKPPVTGGTQDPAVDGTQTPSVQIPPVVDTDVNTPVVDAAGGEAPVTNADPHATVVFVLSVVWLAGVGILLVYMVGSYLRVRRSVRTAVRLRDNIYQCETVASPFVMGIIKPKIYMPFAMSEIDMKYVIAHEEAHIHRRDHWWKPLGFLLLTVYWFNPLMWVAYALLCKDIELACDEKVIKLFSRDQKADYSQALLNCSISYRKIAACPVAFGEVSVKERVKHVLSYKKPSFWVICVSVLAIVLVAVCFLTDPITVNRMSFDELDEDLQALVHESVKEHHKTDATEGRVVATACELIGTSDQFGKTKLYTWVMYTEYSEKDGELTEEVASHQPTVFTVKPSGESYELVEYWAPENDENLEWAVFWEFPRAIRGEAVELRSTEEKLKGECVQLAEKQLPEEKPKEDDKNNKPSDIVEDFGSEFWKGENVTFGATPYADIGFSWSLPFTVVVYNKQLYVNDMLCDSIIHTNSTLSMDDIMDRLDIVLHAEIRKTLEMFQTRRECYYIESKDFFKILFYDIDGTYYFVQLIDGKAARVWIGDLSNQKYLMFKPQLYLQPEGGDWEYSLLIEQYEDELDIYGYTYNQSTLPKDFNLIYSNALVAGANGDTAVLKTLEEIKTQKPYYVLKQRNGPSAEMNDMIVIYEINDSYYFLDCMETGEVTKIWKLSYNSSNDFKDCVSKFPSVPELGDGSGVVSFCERDLTEELEQLRAEYPMYFDLPIENSLELYVWENAKDSYSCVLLPAKDPDYTEEEILALGLPMISMKEMGAIVCSYENEGRENVIVIPFATSYSDATYKTYEAYQSEASSRFWGGAHPIHTYHYEDRIVLDVDMDGVEEECYIMGDLGSGASTHVFVLENGILEYEDRFDGWMKDIHFRGADGMLLIEGTNSPGYYGELKTITWVFSIKEDRIILWSHDDLNEKISYRYPSLIVD